MTIRRGATADVHLSLTVRTGFHVNSNKPDEAYLIPLRLTWNSGAIEAMNTVYPRPSHEKYSFSAKPLSVYTGRIDLVTKFRAGADAPAGPAMLTGRLRYQACNDRACFPPKTVEVTAPVQVQ